MDSSFHGTITCVRCAILKPLPSFLCSLLEIDDEMISFEYDFVIATSGCGVKYSYRYCSNIPLSSSGTTGHEYIQPSVSGSTQTQNTPMQATFSFSALSYCSFGTQPLQLCGLSNLYMPYESGISLIEMPKSNICALGAAFGEQCVFLFCVRAHKRCTENVGSNSASNIKLLVDTLYMVEISDVHIPGRVVATEFTTSVNRAEKTAPLRLLSVFTWGSCIIFDVSYEEEKFSLRRSRHVFPSCPSRVFATASVSLTGIVLLGSFFGNIYAYNTVGQGIETLTALENNASHLRCTENAQNAVCPIYRPYESWNNSTAAGHTGRVETIRWIKPESGTLDMQKTFASGADDRRIIVWYFNTEYDNNKVFSWTSGNVLEDPHRSRIWDVVLFWVQAHGCLCALSAGEDGAANLWDLTRQQRIHRWEKHRPRGIRSVDLSLSFNSQNDVNDDVTFEAYFCTAGFDGGLYLTGIPWAVFSETPYVGLEPCGAKLCAIDVFLCPDEKSDFQSDLLRCEFSTSRFDFAVHEKSSQTNLVKAMLFSAYSSTTKVSALNEKSDSITMIQKEITCLTTMWLHKSVSHVRFLGIVGYSNGTVDVISICDTNRGSAHQSFPTSSLDSTKESVEDCTTHSIQLHCFPLLSRKVCRMNVYDEDKLMVLDPIDTVASYQYDESNTRNDEPRFPSARFVALWSISLRKGSIHADCYTNNLFTVSGRVVYMLCVGTKNGSVFFHDLCNVSHARKAQSPLPSTPSAPVSSFSRIHQGAINSVRYMLEQIHPECDVIRVAICGSDGAVSLIQRAVIHHRASQYHDSILPWVFHSRVELSALMSSVLHFSDRPLLRAPMHCDNFHHEGCIVGVTGSRMQVYDSHTLRERASHTVTRSYRTLRTKFCSTGLYTVVCVQNGNKARFITQDSGSLENIGSNAGFVESFQEGFQGHMIHDVCCLSQPIHLRGSQNVELMACVSEDSTVGLLSLTEHLGSLHLEPICLRYTGRSAALCVTALHSYHHTNADDSSTRRHLRHFLTAGGQERVQLWEVCLQNTNDFKNVSYVDTKLGTDVINAVSLECIRSFTLSGSQVLNRILTLCEIPSKCASEISLRMGITSPLTYKAMIGTSQGTLAVIRISLSPEAEPEKNISWSRTFPTGPIRCTACRDLYGDKSVLGHSNELQSYYLVAAGTGSGNIMFLIMNDVFEDISLSKVRWRDSSSMFPFLTSAESSDMILFSAHRGPVFSLQITQSTCPENENAYYQMITGSEDETVTLSVFSISVKPLYEANTKCTELVFHLHFHNTMRLFRIHCAAVRSVGFHSPCAAWSVGADRRVHVFTFWGNSLDNNVTSQHHSTRTRLVNTKLCWTEVAQAQVAVLSEKLRRQTLVVTGQGVEVLRF